MTQVSTNQNKIIGMDLFFAYIFYAVSVSMNRFLGLGVDPEATNYSLYILILSTAGLLFFTALDLRLILGKKVDRRILIFAGVFVFVLIFVEIAYLSKWIRLFWETYVRTSSALESGEPAFENMKTEIQQVLSAAALILIGIQLVARVFWNWLWTKKILSYDSPGFQESSQA